MKAVFEQVTPKIESSFSTLQLEIKQFDGPYHFHPELELTWIRKGFGRRFIGGNVSDFEPDDLMLIGANVPHCWVSGNQSDGENVQATVIQFRQNFAGETFWGLPELRGINRLFGLCKSGILIKGEIRQFIISKMEKLTAVEGFQKLSLFFEILHTLSASSELEIIDSQFTGITTSPAETERFQRIFSYLIRNYQQEICLKEIAQIANLTPTAFCRYIKHVTRKTLVEIVTEFRIHQACHLLRNSEKSVTEICFECGFGNISYFNKTFKAITEHTPFQYRNLFLEVNT